MEKTSIIISDDLFEQAKGFFNNFSAFVTEAIRDCENPYRISSILSAIQNIAEFVGCSALEGMQEHCS